MKADFQTSAHDYIGRLAACFTPKIIREVEQLAVALLEAWVGRNQIFICGNGGSAANALHMANDFHYGIGACGEQPKKPGLRIEALPANPGIITCLANDTDYDNIYSHQLEVKADKDDLLIVLSGSGNSPNVVNAITTANWMGMQSHAIVAFTGGECKALASHAIHFPINDMQIAEDTQLIVGHLCMQWLNNNKPKQLPSLKNG